HRRGGEGAPRPRAGAGGHPGPALGGRRAPPPRPAPGGPRAPAGAAGGGARPLAPPPAGMDGFRRSHLDALATQRLMHRMPSDLRLAAYDDVRLVALTTQDEDPAAEFVARTLGELGTA